MERRPDLVLAALGRAAAELPELRVGQIIANALPLRFSNDPYYIEDVELAQCIDRFVEQQNYADPREWRKW